MKDSYRMVLGLTGSGSARRKKEPSMQEAGGPQRSAGAREGRREKKKDGPASLALGKSRSGGKRDTGRHLRDGNPRPSGGVRTPLFSTMVPLMEA
ncbi:hypothetical protein SKAU_G00296310 [Synaphobranchus kaupii]|uniref:Uncharacterized protein n=1 Tax=Synaphobranchus kaupii TaxID=118154 RepID=A0A9Q1EUU2_SYNKA|nr:hypothetical protein SKAU_G00296310 [Synaphobranchus kaupii]